MNQRNIALWLALCGFWACPRAAQAEPQPVTIAISTFDFIDTSDEVRDQQQVHAARLDTFMQTLREAIEKDGKYRLVALSGDKADEMGDARKSGAKRLVTGGIHKMSTLVMWMKAGAFDVETGKPIFDRLFTFRSDSDDGWRRAALFLVEELEVLPGQ